MIEAIAHKADASREKCKRTSATGVWCELCASDVLTVMAIGAVTAIAFYTFRAYAISNDEGLQHHYGQLILQYYRSGMTDTTVFGFRDLYLYGGLFDIVAVWLNEIVQVDAYHLRHALCALTGIGGILATAVTARTIAGPRAGFLAAVALIVCGCWYGAMFNHTKDIPLAAGMIGATCMLVRIMRELPRPGFVNVLAFGLLTGCALGIRVHALLLAIYAGFAILLSLPHPPRGHWWSNTAFVLQSSLHLVPAAIVAYLIMIAAWPWAALAPFNPVRALVSFAGLQMHIETLLDGQIYRMETVPRLYVPIYILIRVSLMTLVGAAIALLFISVPSLARRAGLRGRARREVVLIMLAIAFPLACQMIARGPAFTGLRHFTFVLPPLAVLAGIGIDAAAILLSRWRMSFGVAVLAAAGMWFVWNAILLHRLHPYEYLYYNRLIGGLEGADRRYATDYWVSIMPEAVTRLEEYLDREERAGDLQASHGYTVAVCGERVSFERERASFEQRLKRNRLRWMPMQQWGKADFFIAPTHLSCDRILDGRVITTISRLGVPIGYVKDRRAVAQAGLITVPLVDAPVASAF